MNTTCIIARKRKDNTYEAVLCNFDGYTDWTGKQLNEYYKDSNSVDKLFSNGNIYYLNNDGVPIYRGCGDTKSVVSDTMELIKTDLGESEFVYLFENDKWTVNGNSFSRVFGTGSKDGYRVIPVYISIPICADKDYKEVLESVNNYIRCSELVLTEDQTQKHKYSDTPVFDKEVFDQCENF